MKTSGTNHFLIIKKDYTGNFQSSQIEHPAGGTELGVSLTFDSNRKTIYIINNEEKISSNGTQVIDGYSTTNGTLLTPFQYDTNIIGTGDDN